MKIALAKLAVIFLFGYHNIVFGKELGLKEAIDTAMANNHLIKNQSLIAEYRNILRGSGNTIEQAIFSVDYGQMNSVYNDLKLSVTQRYEFPTIYSKQHDVLKEEWNAAVLSKDISIAELKKNVCDVYYALLLLKSKEEILKEVDSIYGEYVRISDIRFKKGESNILENAHHRIEQSTIQMQLKDLKNSLRIVEMQFQLLLNTPVLHTPRKDALTIRYTKEHATDPQRHPFVRQSKQSIDIARAKQALEESRYLPDLQIGISNQSIQGVGADNVLYPMSRRFTSISLGIGIPHPFGSQKAIVEASKTAVKISETEYEYQLKKLTVELQTAKIGRDSLFNTLTNYEQQQLPLIKTVREAADIQYKAGEITYLEWTAAMHQTMEIQSQYIDVLQRYFELSNTVTYLEEQ